MLSLHPKNIRLQGQSSFHLGSMYPVLVVLAYMHTHIHPLLVQVFHIHCVLTHVSNRYYPHDNSHVCMLFHSLQLIFLSEDTHYF